MSRLDEQLENPATKFLEWDSDNKCFKYYKKFPEKKEDGTKGENILVPLPFTFLVLDILTTVKGYNDDEQSGYYSNEVKNISTDILKVRTKKGTAATGTWEEIKGILRDAKFCASVYVAIKGDKGELEIANLQLKGAAVSSWFDFAKDNKKQIYKMAITVNDSIHKTKGKTEYNEPVFNLTPISPKTDNEALELAKVLKVYHDAYFSNTEEVPVDETPEIPEPTKGEQSDSLDRKSVV